MVDQLRPVMRPRLYEVIVEQLCLHIPDNEMVAGDRLPPERELAAKLGVSRASLSQALVALEGWRADRDVSASECHGALWFRQLREVTAAHKA